MDKQRIGNVILLAVGVLNLGILGGIIWIAARIISKYW